MHELLAPLLLVLDREKIFVQENETDELAILCNSEYLEHDAFVTFSNLMLLVKDWYRFDGRSSGKRIDYLFENEYVKVVLFSLVVFTWNLIV